MELLLVFLFAALGSVIASFIGVVSERLHTGQSWKKGRSRCDSCAVELGTLDLIPVISWLLSRGRCRACGSRISSMHLVREVSLAVVFALAYWSLGLSFALLVFVATASVLAFIVAYDLRHTVIPMFANILLAGGALLYAVITVPDSNALGFALLIAGLIALFMFSLFAFSKGRAMGLGDTPVAFSLSLLAAPYALAGLLFSFWIGAIVGIAILAVRRGGPKMGVEVPFAPFLAVGFLLAYFIKWNPLALVW